MVNLRPVFGFIYWSPEANLHSIILNEFLISRIRSIIFDRITFY